MNQILDKKVINYGEAIYEATFQEMAQDESVFVYGLGVDDPKGHYGTSSGGCCSASASVTAKRAQ
mgnify:CR=1 FL=1